MPGVKIDGTRDDLRRFASSMQRRAVGIEPLSAAEHRVRWQAADRSGQTHVMALRSGMLLTSSHVSWERPWSMSIDHAPSRLKFILMRGAGPLLTAGDDDGRPLSGGTFHVSQVKRPVQLRFDFDTSSRTTQHAELALEIDRARLCDLLGAARLPAAAEGVLESALAYPSVELSMTPALFRLFDEIAHCDARGPSRPLYLDAKGLELLAALTDALDEDARATKLSRCDIECLELARHLLLSRLENPPSLTALARSAGINEAKLKAGFRALFGSPVYVYLRARRMEEARRLLHGRRYSVAEVALRVGYANPSKFAAAFRKHFGVPPARS